MACQMCTLIALLTVFRQNMHIWYDYCKAIIQEFKLMPFWVGKSSEVALHASMSNCTWNHSILAVPMHWSDWTWGTSWHVTAAWITGSMWTGNSTKCGSWYRLESMSDVDSDPAWISHLAVSQQYKQYAKGVALESPVNAAAGGERGWSTQLNNQIWWMLNVSRGQHNVWGMVSSEFLR